jgi:hypothetical protein
MMELVQVNKGIEREYRMDADSLSILLCISRFNLGGHRLLAKGIDPHLTGDKLHLLGVSMTVMGEMYISVMVGERKVVGIGKSVFSGAVKRIQVRHLEIMVVMPTLWLSIYLN